MKKYRVLFESIERHFEYVEAKGPILAEREAIKRYKPKPKVKYVMFYE